MTAEDWRCPSCQQGCAYCTGSEGEAPPQPEPSGPTTPVTLHLSIDGTQLAEVIQTYVLQRARRNPGSRGMRAV